MAALQVIVSQKSLPLAGLIRTGDLPPPSSRVPEVAAHAIATRMPSRTARYARYSPRQRRRRFLANRSVHFPNDVLFLDHIRQGDLEQVGRFIRTRKVSLDTIYPSGECLRGQ